MKYLVLLCFTIALASCGSVDPIKVADEEIPYCKNEGFVNGALPFPVTVNNLQEQFPELKFKVNKTPVTNKHLENVVDTIYELEGRKAKFVIHRAQGKDLFESAVIRTDKVVLSDNITIGMGKTDFVAQVGCGVNADKFHIGNLEKTAIWTFAFSNDELEAVQFAGYVD